MPLLNTLTIARDRGLGLEAHRVLRCLEEILSFERHVTVDTRSVAQMLEMQPQAVSRALRILVERQIIARGAPAGRSSTFRFIAGAGNQTAHHFEATLRSAEEADLAGLARAGAFGATYSRDDFHKDIAGGRCWVLLIGDAIVGQLAIRKDPSIEMSYLLARVLVDRRFRRRGLGRRLLVEMERSLNGNRIHAYCSISDSGFLKFLVETGFTLSGYVKGRQERETRLFFGKIAEAAADDRSAPLVVPSA